MIPDFRQDWEGDFQSIAFDSSGSISTFHGLDRRPLFDGNREDLEHFQSLVASPIRSEERESGTRSSPPLRVPRSTPDPSSPEYLA